MKNIKKNKNIEVSVKNQKRLPKKDIEITYYKLQGMIPVFLFIGILTLFTTTLPSYFFFGFCIGVFALTKLLKHELDNY